MKVDIKVDFRVPDGSGYGLYVCKDNKGIPYMFTPEQLKIAISRGKVNVVNMKMGSNGALRYTKEYLDTIGISENNIKEYEAKLISDRHNPGNGLSILMSGCNGNKKILDKHFSYQMTQQYQMLAKHNIIQLNQNFAFYHYYATNLLNSAGYPIGRIYYQIDRDLKFELSMVEVYDCVTNIFPNPDNSGIVYAESDNGIARFIGVNRTELYKILYTVCKLPGGMSSKPKILNIKQDFTIEDAKADIFENSPLDEDMTRLYRATPDRINLKISKENLNSPYFNTIMVRDYLYRNQKDIQGNKTEKAELFIDTPKESVRDTERLVREARGIFGLLKAFRRD